MNKERQDLAENGDHTALREKKEENGDLCELREHNKHLTNNNVEGELSSDCSHPASGRNVNILVCKSSANFPTIILTYQVMKLHQNIKFTVNPGCIRIKSRILPKLRLGRRYKYSIIFMMLLQKYPEFIQLIYILVACSFQVSCEKICKAL